MAGMSTRDDHHFHAWTGGLNITYRLGPGFTDDLQLRVVVNNEISEKIIYNVVGVLDGHLEPDRYVIMGNHRDSWGFGALDASSGGAAMLETARVIGNYHNATGWRPRRSIIFASWAGEEQGLIGSTEWVEDLRMILSARTVAYVNVDMCVNGPALWPDISPSLMNMFTETIKRVPSHRFPAMPDKKNVTLYDNMLKYSYDNVTKSPRINPLASGSDHVPFAFYAAIPSINLEFDLPKGEYPSTLQPAYHTSYDTFNQVKKYVDPDFSIHQTCSRLLSTLLYSLSSSSLVPLRVTDLAARIRLDFSNSALPKQMTELVGIDHKNLLDRIGKAIDEFVKTADTWQDNLNKLNRTGELVKDAYLLRSINDVLMSVERTFTDNSGRALENRPDARNLLYGTPLQDFYTTLLFPGLHDLIHQLKMANVTSSQGENTKINQSMERHANDIVLAFENACRLLQSHVI